MAFSPRRGRKPPTPTPPPAKSSDNIFSTFIVHKDDDNDGREHLSGDDIDDESLPPLLKRLPKDFGGAGSFDFDAETSDDISGTFIVKPDHHHRNNSNINNSYQYSSTSSIAAPHSVRRSRNPVFSSPRPEVNPRRIEVNDDDGDEEEEEEEGDFGTFVVKKGKNEVDDDVEEVEEEEDEDEEEGEGEEFGTFVVRKTARKRREKESEEVSGTFVRKTSGGGGSTMSRAVASMQAVGELGFGGRNKRSGGGGSGQLEDGSGQVRQLQSKMSSSSIPECIAREDPSSKYELLHELGEFHASEIQVLVNSLDHVCAYFNLGDGL